MGKAIYIGGFVFKILLDIIAIFHIDNKGLILGFILKIIWDLWAIAIRLKGE